MTEAEKSLTERAALAFLHAAAEQRGAQPILDAAYELIGLPIELTDTVFQLIAQTRVGRSDGERQHSEDTKYLPEFRKWMRKVTGSTEPVIDESSEPYRVMCYDVRVRGAEVAKLAMFEKGRAFRESDAELLKLLSSALACVLGEESSSLPDRRLCDLVRDLIENRVESREAERLGELFHIKREETRYLLVMEDTERSPAGYPLLVSRCFHRLGGTAVILGETVACLLEGEQTGELEAFLRENDLRGGLSRHFSTLNQLRDCYLQAEFALRRVRRSGGSLLSYEFCVGRDVAEHCLSDRSAESFCRPEVLKLREYDRANGTDYLNTLECYCRNLGSVTDTARDCFLHCNTIKYRMKIIRELTDMGELNGAELFEYWLSFRFLEAENEQTGGY